MAKRGTLDDNTVWKVEEIKKIPNSDEARKLLLRVKEHADNVLKARGWKVKRLIEICCCERKNMGTNLGVGGWCRGDGPGAAHTIALRLRRPRSHEFVSFEHCLKVMWHEMAHIVHGNHSAAFYQEMDDIARHYELIKSKGQLVGLDGFPIGGGRNADPQRHNPSRAEGRAAGLKAAEARAKKQRVMGGGRLGGGASHKKLSPREAAARAAERRAQDARNGLGDAELEVAAGRGEKRKSGPGLVWDGTFRAVCPVCGPVCTDKVEHAEVISDSDDDDLAGPVDYTQESQADEKAPAPAKPAARPRPAPTAQARRPAPSPPPPPADRRPAKRKAPPSPIDLTAEDSDGGSGPPAAAWTCARCTLLNSGGDVCNACAAPRNAGAQEEADAALARRLQGGRGSQEEADAALARRLQAEGQAPRPAPEPAPFDPCKPSLNGSSMARPAKK